MDAEYITRGELLLQYFSAVEELEGEDGRLKGNQGAVLHPHERKGPREDGELTVSSLSAL
ncbi:MAG: hypothetical protein LAQ69_28065 [Acidobacteriia bacterium]|nr:hypothetical protein [Terriglobia bacterium]